MSLRREFSNRCMEGKVEKIYHRDQCWPALPSLRHLLVHSLQQMEPGCWDSGPQRGLGWRYSREANTAQLRSPGKRLGQPEGRGYYVWDPLTQYCLQTSGHLWDGINATNIQIIRFPEGKRKRRGVRKYLRVIAENFFNMGNKIIPKSRKPRSLIQYKPKENYGKTHINKTNKIKHKEKY